MSYPSMLVYAATTAAGATLAAVTLPLVVELWALSCAALLPVRGLAWGTKAIRLAAVVPAHNEQALIAACVASLRASTLPGLAVYVVAHNCSDRTAEHAGEAGAEVLVLNDANGGKGAALDHGFRHALAAGADAVLVVDADSIVEAALPQAVARAFAGGADAVQARYVAGNAQANRRTRLAALALLGMNVLRPRGRERLGCSCGIFGNGFALSAQALRRVPYTPNSLVEDLEYHLHLVRAGLRVRFLDRVAVLGEMPEGAAAAGSQRARWEGGRILMRRQFTPLLARQVLAGRLRFAEPLLDLLALPLATGAVLLAAAFSLGVLAPWLTHTPGALLWLRIYAGFGLLALPLYVAVAASLSEAPAETLKAVVGAPAYLVWKLQRGRTRKAAEGRSAWVRTARNAETKTENEV